MKLVIVESPTKAKTIETFLGKGYKVLSSFGHIRDLPKDKIGIDLEHDFEPKYVVPMKARKTVNSLKKESAKAESTILATDEDREGEAIAWHLQEVLELKNPERIVFHEITQQAIAEALQHPRTIDINRVDAQQARRILDRLVGYKLSPFLWKKIARGLSAGRVQSVAVRFVADREKEIVAFTAEEYWSIEAFFEKSNVQFQAALHKKDGKALAKLAIAEKKEADAIVKDLQGATYAVEEVEKKEQKKNPLPPFTTSTLQQDAWRRLRFPARLTMSLAQRLYETGLITYHRTDSLNLAASSLEAAQTYIQKTYGKEYWSQRRFKTKAKGAQEAHEAIRPTSLDSTAEPKGLQAPALKLYDLIKRRFLASQMSSAVVDATVADIAAAAYTFRATGQVLKFDGFLKAYPMKFEDIDLPVLEQGETLPLANLTTTQHFTQPPARFTEATLVKALEEHGVGRPSTYAPILSTIQERGYVEKDENKRLKPTELGTLVNDLLVEHFPQVVDVTFTAAMEEGLDNIAQGEKQWVRTIKEFYNPFAENLEKKYQEVSKDSIVKEVSDKLCPQCGSPLVIRFGRFGRFYACSTFPSCRHTEPIEKKEVLLGIACPKCTKAASEGGEPRPAGRGEIVAKRTKRKKLFYGCNQYPACDFALWQKPTGKPCDACGSLLVEVKKDLIKCSNKECEHSR